MIKKAKYEKCSFLKINVLVLYRVSPQKWYIACREIERIKRKRRVLYHFAIFVIV